MYMYEFKIMIFVCDSFWKMKEDLIKSERVRTIQESLCGFLMDEVINPAREFYTDHRISVGQLDENKEDNEQE
jgi:hypothetical protein